MNYFEILFKYNPQRYEFGSPVFLCEVAIIKDTVDNEILLRNTMRNVGIHRIVAVSVSIVMKDIFGESVYIDESKKIFRYIYQDISFEPKSLFGNKVPIKLHSNVRKVEVSLDRVVFENGAVWKSQNNSIAFLQEQKHMQEPDTFGKWISGKAGVNCRFYYVDNDTCWQCTCGQPNERLSEKCINCGLDKSYAKSFLTQEKVSEQYKIYLAEEEKKKRFQEEQRRKEEERRKIKGEQDRVPENVIYNLEDKRGNENVIDNTIDNEKWSLWKNKKIFVIVGILIVSIIVFYVHIGRTSDREVAAVIAEGVQNRCKQQSAFNSIEQYENLVNAEAETLYYVDKKFENKNYELYIAGLKEQKESLQYITSEINIFRDMWNEGQNLRYDAAVKLAESNDLDIVDEVYSESVIYMLICEISTTITDGGEITLHLDIARNQYYYETTFKNTSDISLEDISLNLSFGDKTYTCSTEKWEAGKNWHVKIYFDNETINQDNLFSAEFVKYKYNDLVVDKSGTSIKNIE